MNCTNLITSYAAPSEEQRIIQSRFLTFISEVAYPTRRDTIPGHLTTSAFIINVELKSVLLTHHLKFDRWMQLGGHIEPEDRSLLDSAMREAREESGLKVLQAYGTSDKEALIDLDIHEIPARGDMPAHLHYDVRFLLTTSEVVFRVEQTESHALAWCPLDNLNRYTGEVSIVRAVGAARERCTPSCS